MARPLKRDVKPIKPADKRRKSPGKPEREPSGEPGEMNSLGESISGTQPEIGHKDTGVGRRLRERPEYPPTAP